MPRRIRYSDTGKDVYFTPATADHSAASLGAKNHIRLDTYQCSFCHFWHLTKARGSAPKDKVIA